MDVVKIPDPTIRSPSPPIPARLQGAVPRPCDRRHRLALILKEANYRPVAYFPRERRRDGLSDPHRPGHLLPLQGRRGLLSPSSGTASSPRTRSGPTRRPIRPWTPSPGAWPSIPTSSPSRKAPRGRGGAVDAIVRHTDSGAGALPGRTLAPDGGRADVDEASGARATKDQVRRGGHGDARRAGLHGAGGLGRPMRQPKE